MLPINLFDKMDNNNKNNLFLEEAAKLSKEKKMLKKFMQRYRNILKSNNISAKDFTGLLKEHSKKENAPKGWIYSGIFNKEDLFVLFQFLYGGISLCDNSKCRCIRDRASYPEKNEILTFFAINFPALMKTDDIFDIEEFSYKLYNKDILIQKWKGYVDEIQEKLQSKDLDDDQPEMQPIPATVENTQPNNYPNPAVNENQLIMETANINIPYPQNQISQENESGLNCAQNTYIDENANQIPVQNNFANISNSPLEPGENLIIDDNVEAQHEIFPETLNNQMVSDPTDIPYWHDNYGEAYDDFIYW